MIQTRVSEEFAEYLNKVFEEKGIEAHAEYKTCNERHYRFHVDSDIVTAYELKDCNEWGDEYYFIQVSYPDNYYAVPHNATTRELREELCDRVPGRGLVPCKDEDVLKERIVDMFEI